MGGERQPGIDCLRMRDHSQKNLGIRIRPTYFRIIKRYSRLPVELRSTPWTNREPYEASLDVTQSHPLRMQDAFRPISGLISCAGVTGRWGLPYHAQNAVRWLDVENNRRVYEVKDAFLRIPTSFDKSVHYEVLSFACLTVNKESWVQGGVATPLSC